MGSWEPHRIRLGLEQPGEGRVVCSYVVRVSVQEDGRAHEAGARAHSHTHTHARCAVSQVNLMYLLNLQDPSVPSIIHMASLPV